jgi:hypothetical protein
MRLLMLAGKGRKLDGFRNSVTRFDKSTGTHIFVEILFPRV